MNTLQIPPVLKQKRLLRNALETLFLKKNKRGRLLMIFVYVPTVLLALYLFFFFTPMYVSESHFALRSSDTHELPSMPGMLFQATASTTMDAYILQSYIRSTDMLDKACQLLDILDHYSAASRDVYSRLKRNPTKEELLEYWQWLVSVSFELEKGIISVEVKAYTPEMAKAINDVILACSEDLVNQMNDRAHQDAIRLAQQEVVMAEKRVLQAQAALQAFRDDKAILDPQATAKGLEGVIVSLETEAATVQAELNAALEIMHKNSPRVLTLKTRLRALQEQLIKEKTRMAGLNAQSATLSSLVGDYNQLIMEEKFAQDRLVRSMAALETARLKAMSKSRYIVPFQPPTQPEESLYPRPFLFTLFGFLAFLILLGICSLIVAAIKDHMGV